MSSRTTSSPIAAACCVGLALGIGSAAGHAASLGSPNVLLIVSDDQGLDASAQYTVSEDQPFTPHLDQLAADGLVFDNAWATPACTTTRGALLTGLHGHKSGVDTVPDRLDTARLTLHEHLRQGSGYSTALIGKWHLAGGRATDDFHPIEAGVGHFAGTLSGTVDSYTQWPLSDAGAQRVATTYHTTAMTDLAIDWIGAQGESPWFLWLAYVAPHAPFHLPPADLHARQLSGTAADIRARPRDYYLAAIEAMDTEIGRLVASLPDASRENTLILYIGDNGTPSRVIDTTAYAKRQGKGTLYEGGIRVPLLASGAGVARRGEREAALVNAVDVYATLAELTGAGTPANLDSVSFADLLAHDVAAPRRFNYSEFKSRRTSGWAVRDDTVKLIAFDDGSRELYDLVADPREQNNVINRTAQYGVRVAALNGFALAVQAGNAVSTVDAAGVTDITDALLTRRSANCADYAEWQTTSAVRDVNTNTRYSGEMRVSVEGGQCVFESNAIPNHDLNDGARRFRNPVAEQDQRFSVTASPAIAANPTPLSLRLDNAVLLNGVKVDLLAAGCFGVRDGRIGCNDPNQPWRYDPMFRENGFGVDSHNAHTQPDGTYHYHGPPNALYSNNSSEPSPVVGFAADGFPIFGSLIQDGDRVRAVRSSYRLKTGQRPSGAGDPGGSYDGAFRDDYEYVAGLGDLDACNGMTVDGQYGYYMTEVYPYVLACFKGTPDDSFRKRRRR